MAYPRWLNLAIKFDAENFKEIPIPSNLVSDNGISLVYSTKKYVYKRSIPFLTENEIFCLDTMSFSGYVPRAWRYDKYTVMMKNLGKSQPVTDEDYFRHHMDKVLFALNRATIRHGDLTTANIIVKNNHPFIIDWAESRFGNDIRADKRPESDKYWLTKSCEELCKRS